MTEYTDSPSALLAYQAQRERTAFWVASREPGELFSPNRPPTDIPSTPASEVESSHSIPPKMILRWPAESPRPDVEIPNDHKHAHRNSSRRHHRDKQPSNDDRQRDRTISPKRHPSSGSRSRRHKDSPEDIRILPSHEPLKASHHSTKRSKSLPPDNVPKHSPRLDEYACETNMVPPLPPPPVSAPVGQHWHGYHAQPRLPTQDYGQSSHTKFSHSRKLSAPAVVYAPSGDFRPSKYAPPAIYSHPPQFGPNGVIYSHSAPLANTQYYPPPREPEYHSRHERHSSTKTKRGDSSSKHTERTDSRRRRRPPALDLDVLEETQSNDSGGTYYVVPRSAGQKIVIASPDSTMYAPTSTTKSPTSPQSPGAKKPFFQRLWTRLSSVSTTTSPKAEGLVRRHSDS